MALIVEIEPRRLGSSSRSVDGGLVKRPSGEFKGWLGGWEVSRRWVDEDIMKILLSYMKFCFFHELLVKVELRRNWSRCLELFDLTR